MVAAGRLDRFVTIERKTIVQDEVGQPVEVWAPWMPAFMGKKDVRAGERFASEQELATETTVWISHYIEGLTAEDRLNAEGRLWDILGIAELGRRAGLEITAEAKV